ncbi:MAG: hypothetical protein JNG83_08270 [Opitutaceae bacterium]|nr:hypothetical protein [Opitutaceae bacterium]
MTRIPFRMAMRPLAAVLGMMAAARAAEPEAFIGTSDRWRHLVSPHFEVYSQESEREARRQLYHLEVLHAVFFDMLKFVEPRRTPMTVYGFNQEKAFAAYIPRQFGRDRVSGFFFAGPDRDVIVTGPAFSDRASREMIFHEFVHRMVRATGKSLPPWYNEGLAELFATVQVDRKTNSVELGRLSPNRVRVAATQKFLPMEQLFAIGYDSPLYVESKHAGIFYAQSWATLHYWLFGQSKLPPDAAGRFLERVSGRGAPQGAQLREEFKAIFGIDYPEMQRRIESYLSGGRYLLKRQNLPDIPTEDTYEARPVPVDEIRIRLAELALRVNRTAEARAFLKKAVRQAARKGGPDARLLEALGGDALMGKDEAWAMVWWLEAVEEGSMNPAVVRYVSQAEACGELRSFNLGFRLSEEAAERLRMLLTRSLALEPEQSAGYEQLAMVEAAAPRPLLRNLVLVQQNFSRIGDLHATGLMFALACHRLGRTEEALGMLDELARHPQTEQAASRLAEVRALIAGTTPETKAGADPAGSGESGLKE